MIETYYHLSSRMKQQLQEKYCPDPQEMLLRNMQVMLLGGQAALLRCTSKAETIELPESYQGSLLTIIGTAAFAGHRELKSLTIPDSVTEIAAYAFYDCPQLVLRGTAGSCAERAAVRDGIPFESLEYDYTVTSKGVCLTAFRGSAGEVTVPQHLLGKPVVSIGERAFASRQNLHTIVLPEGLEEIGSQAFANCGVLSQVRFPSTLHTIGSGAFQNCRLLKTLSLQNVTRLGEGAFGHCLALETVSLPEGVEYVSPKLFEGCFSLREVLLPGSLRRIGAGAFQGCRSLRQAAIPSRVSFVASDAFAQCGLLTLKALEGSPAEACIRNAGLPLKQIPKPTPPPPPAPKKPELPFAFEEKEGKICLTDYLGQDTEVQVPAVVGGKAVVGLNGTFRNNGTVQRVKLPEGIRYIGENSFANCQSLRKVSLPSTVVTIHENAFLDCAALRDLSLPDSLEQIGAAAFSGCRSLQSLLLPGSVEVIGQGAFKDCVSLASIRLPLRVRSAEGGLFFGCSALQEVTLPEGIKALDAGMFYRCVSLLRVNLPDSLKNLNPGVFSSCIRLQSLQASPASSYLSVGGVLFDHSGKTILLMPQGQQKDSYALPNGVTAIGPGAFYNCRSLKTLSASQETEILTIGEGAFENCENLREISIVLSEEKIRDRVFKNCRSMCWMTLPPGVTGIGKEAFAGCGRLEKVVVPDSVQEIHEDAFVGCTAMRMKVKKFSFAQRFAKEHGIPFESALFL